MRENPSGLGGQPHFVIGRADCGGHHRAAGVEIAVGQHAFPELDELPQQHLGTQPGGVVDVGGDRIPGIAQRLGEDLIAPVGKVVVHRAARRAAAGEHLVDGHARGTAFTHHLSGADQHVGSGIAALTAGTRR